MSAIKNSVASPARGPAAGSGTGTAAASTAGVTGVGVGDEHAPASAATETTKADAAHVRAHSDKGEVGSFIAADVKQRARAGSISSARGPRRERARSRIVVGALGALALFHVSACRGDEASPPERRGDDAAATPSLHPTDERTTAPSAAPRPRLGELRLVDMTPPLLRPPTVAADVDGIVRGAFAVELERAPDDDASACRAAVQIGYTLVVNHEPVRYADAGDARAWVEAELFCPAPPGGSGAARDDVDAYRVSLDSVRSFGGSAGGTSDAALREALGAVMGDAVGALYGQTRMRRARDADVLATLAASGAPAHEAGADHPGVLGEAASEAGERHLVAGASDLARLTAHPNARVAARAGAALGQLKVATPEVLKALVRMTEGPDPEKHLVAMHALADLGTPEAKRYLESLALGHPSPTMRELARERLRQLGVAVPDEPKPEPAPEPVSP